MAEEKVALNLTQEEKEKIKRLEKMNHDEYVEYLIKEKNMTPQKAGFMAGVTFGTIISDVEIEGYDLQEARKKSREEIEQLEKELFDELGDE